MILLPTLAPFVGAAAGWALGAVAHEVLRRASERLRAVGYVTTGGFAFGVGLATGALLSLFAWADIGDEAAREAILGMYATLTGNVALLAFARGVRAPVAARSAPAVAWVAAAGVVTVALGVSAAWAALLTQVGESPAQAAFTFLGGAADPRVVALSGAFIVVGAPVTEELVWRGLVYGAIGRRLGRRAAIGLSSVLFGVFHAADPLAVPPILVLGLLLGLLRDRAGSALPGILAHVVFNAVGFALLLAPA